MHCALVAKRAVARGWLRSASADPCDVVSSTLRRGCRWPVAEFFRIRAGVYGLASWLRKKIRRTVRKQLREQGFVVGPNDTIIGTGHLDKGQIRAIHQYARKLKWGENEDFVNANGERLIRYFANGDELCVSRFQPRVVLVESGTLEADLFRFSTLLWSVPVSHGFGRRTRFVVFDDSNNRLVGLFALGDPVFNLRIRDEWIGWDHSQRADRLFNVMDVFVLGAVPPYNELLCGKLMALLAASNEVRETIRARYAGRPTIIRGEAKDPRLVLLTTTSALGRSSLYNRLKVEGRLIYQRIGLTEGWGHFHLCNGTFEAMKRYLEAIDHPVVCAHQYGSGPNWKIRVGRTCLVELGMSPDLLKHGVRRELYAVCLASNFREFLCGEARDPIPLDMPARKFVEYFKDRWMVGRAAREANYAAHDRASVLKAIYASAN
jgi:hypothetical protein